MKLTLVRHGETDELVQGIIQGQIDNPLNAAGRSQAEAAASKIAGRSFDVIYCSDLRRAQESAEPIRAALPGVPFITDTLLRERKGGEWENHKVTREQEAQLAGTRYTHRFPGGGESWEDTRARQIPLLNKLYDQYPEGSVLIISHGGPLHGIISLLEHRTLEDVWEHTDLPNSSIREVEMTQRIPIYE